jgi:hypothetical protein
VIASRRVRHAKGKRADTQRERRGHEFLADADALDKIPPLYATEHIPPEDKIIHLHYFSAASDHFVAEVGYDEDAGAWLAFGYAILAVCPDGAEWGYFSLDELEQVSAHGGLVIIERIWTGPRHPSPSS